MLGNHASNIDFLFSIVALYPKRMNFLVSAHFFNQKPLCYLLRLVQCVRKEQFATDVAAIRDMRSLVTAGGNILLYPEGEVNGTGRTGIFQESTARLTAASVIDLTLTCFMTAAVDCAVRENE